MRGGKNARMYGGGTYPWCPLPQLLCLSLSVKISTIHTFDPHKVCMPQQSDILTSSGHKL